MRRFQLKREVDVTGISGTGIVAEGVEFTSGFCSLTWFGDVTSYVLYKSIEDVEKIHGHNGSTKVFWID